MTFTIVNWTLNTPIMRSFFFFLRGKVFAAFVTIAPPLHEQANQTTRFLRANVETSREQVFGCAPRGSEFGSRFKTFFRAYFHLIILILNLSCKGTDDKSDTRENNDANGNNNED